MFNLFLWLGLCFSSQIFGAEPALLGEGQLVKAERLFEFRNEPGRYIFVAEAAFERHVFEIRDQSVQEIRLLNPSTGVEGGIEIRLEDGRHLSVPPRSVPGRSAPILTEPYMVFPDRAREPLEERPISHSRLVRLGLGHLVEKPAPSSRSTGDNPVRQVAPQDAVLIYVRYFDLEAGTQSKLRNDLRQVVESSQGCFLLDFNKQRLLNETLLALCPPSKAVQLQETVRNLGDPEVIVLRTHQDIEQLNSSVFDGDLFGAMKAMGVFTQRLSGALAAARRLLDSHSTWRGQHKTEAFATSLLGIDQLLSELDSLSESLVDQLLQDQQYEIVRKRNLPVSWVNHESVKEQARAEVQTTALFNRLVLPLRKLTASLLRQCRAIGLDETNRLTLRHLGSADGQLAEQYMTPELLAFWLDWNLKQLDFGFHLPRLQTASEGMQGGWSIQRHERGLQSLHLNTLLIHVNEGSSYGSSTFFGDLQLRAPGMSPALQLGLRHQDQEAKKLILTFIIQAESRIAEIVPKVEENMAFLEFTDSFGDRSGAHALLKEYWMNNTVPPSLRVLVPVLNELISLKQRAQKVVQSNPPTGSIVMYNFIKSLVWPNWLNRRVQGYDEVRYFYNLAQILSELLEDSEIVLKTQGTFLTVLDAALHVQARAYRGSLSGGLSRPDFQRSIQRLGLNIQRAMLRALPVLQSDSSLRSACTVILSPNPNAARQALRGVKGT